MGAALQFNLAPLAARRDMAMLGLLRHVVLGKASPHFDTFISTSTFTKLPRDLRAPEHRYNKQLHDPIDSCHLWIMQRSVFGLIYTYNMLRQHVVDTTTVCTFQRRLQWSLVRLA